MSSSVNPQNIITLNFEILGTNEKPSEGIAQCAMLLSNVSMCDQGLTYLRVKLHYQNYNIRNHYGNIDIIVMANVLHLISLHRSAAWLDPTYKH